MTAAVIALIATIAVEVVVVVVVVRPRGVTTTRLVVVSVVANVLTHPALWWTVSRHDDRTGAYLAVLVAAEAAVCAVEWLVLVVGLRGHGVPALDLLGVSVLANSITTAIGLSVAVAAR
ncbi:MAG: hypothetical protein ABW328_16575 [Ilumatobacteraceae bacterium]